MDFNNEIMIYDAEIINAIPGEDEQLLPGINYCEGWTDFKGMGISVVCAHLVNAGTYHVFMEDNLDVLAYLISEVSAVAGFNSARFDEPLLEACWGISVPQEKSYDFRHEILKAAGHDTRRHHHGYSLERCCGANSGGVKNGHGALAPIWWQRGNAGQVIDYCLGDVVLLRDLHNGMTCDLAGTPNFIDPVSGAETIVALPGMR